MADISLDAIDFKNVDEGAMYQHIEGFFSNFLIWWKLANSFPLPSHFVKANKIVISGMGGSAQAGTIAKDLLFGESKVTVELVRDYHLPAYVDRNTLVIAISYSGTTEETINTFIEAYSKGAMLLGIGTGGQMAALARKYKVPYFEHDYEAQPRAALHVHLAAVLNFMSRLGHVTISDEMLGRVDELETYMRAHWVETIPEGNNEAKQLARKMFNHVPIVIGDGVLCGVAGRIKSHFNENAKSMAYYELLPEMNHNALVGSERPVKSPEWLHLLLLDSKYTDEQNKTRMVLTEQLFKDRKFKVTRQQFNSSSPLEEVLLAVSFGDYVSYYLALLNQVDPTAVNVIAQFKSKLAH